jgi:hypothetical protein
MLISIDTLRCRGTTVGDRGSMAWMPEYIAVSNLLSMISMVLNEQLILVLVYRDGILYPA